ARRGVLQGRRRPGDPVHAGGLAAHAGRLPAAARREPHRARQGGQEEGGRRPERPEAATGTMTFQWPWLLWSLGLIPPLIAVYVLWQRRRVRYAARFTTRDLLANVVPRHPAWRRHLPALLYLLALAALLVSLGRPAAV